MRGLALACAARSCGCCRGRAVARVGLTAGSAGEQPHCPCCGPRAVSMRAPTGAGQAARIATDASGNVAVVSGPAGGRDLAVTSYTATGSLRWRRTVSPASGTFTGDWIVAAPNGDFVAVGHNVDSQRQPDRHHPGPLRLRRDASVAGRPRSHAPSVARLLVDTEGNAYLAFSSVGDGQDIQVHKYSPSGVLLWSQVVSTGSFANDIATSLALSPDETDVVVTGDIVRRRRPGSRPPTTPRPVPAGGWWRRPRAPPPATSSWMPRGCT